MLLCRQLTQRPTGAYYPFSFMLQFREDTQSASSNDRNFAVFRGYLHGTEHKGKRVIGTRGPLRQLSAKAASKKLFGKTLSKTLS